tara:strand:+ start:1156 stop:2130 length:975 start_codon:yes stop_codon:yes gene_type:complete
MSKIKQEKLENDLIWETFLAKGTHTLQEEGEHWSQMPAAHYLKNFEKAIADLEPAGDVREWYIDAVDKDIDVSILDKILARAVQSGHLHAAEAHFIKTGQSQKELDEALKPADENWRLKQSVYQKVQRDQAKKRMAAQDKEGEPHVTKTGRGEWSRQGGSGDRPKGHSSDPRNNPGARRDDKKMASRHTESSVPPVETGQSQQGLGAGEKPGEMMHIARGLSTGMKSLQHIVTTQMDGGEFLKHMTSAKISGISVTKDNLGELLAAMVSAVEGISTNMMSTARQAVVNKPAGQIVPKTDVPAQERSAELSSDTPDLVKQALRGQ